MNISDFNDAKTKIEVIAKEHKKVYEYTSEHLANEAVIKAIGELNPYVSDKEWDLLYYHYVRQWR